MRAEPYDRQAQSPLLESLEILSGAAGMLVVCAVWYVGTERYHLTDRQVAEIVAYAVIGLTTLGVTVILAATRRSRREMEWPHPPTVVPTRKDERYTHKAWSQDAVVLGYDVHGRPWPSPDSVPVMQGIVLGMTGTGKTTLLRNIISQHLMRLLGTPAEPRRLPMW